MPIVNLIKDSNSGIEPIPHHYETKLPTTVAYDPTHYQSVELDASIDMK